MPHAFSSAEGPVYYIDYENGDDNQAGTREAPFRHHPWDERARARAAVVEAGPGTTFVFRGGVTYRGSLQGRGQGESGRPIRLTVDPSWGSGEAVISGAELVRGQWRRLSASEATALGFPQASRDHLWSVALRAGAVPHALWYRSEAEALARLPLAREPDWEIANVYDHFSEWYRVEELIEKVYPRTRIGNQQAFKALDGELEGATIWIDQPNASGEFSITGPNPSRLTGHKREEGTATMHLLVPNRHPVVGSPFYLENKPAFLDEDGEWYYREEGADAGRLYLRLPGDVDPNTARVEVARHPILIALRDQQHIEISGLSFEANNSIDPDTMPHTDNWRRPSPALEMAAIKLLGDCRHLRLQALRFRDLAGMGIGNLIERDGDRLEDVVVSDSSFERIDNAGVVFKRGFLWRRERPKGELLDVRVLRNYFADIGHRNSGHQGQAIDLMGASTAEIAGNVIERVAHQGINVLSGKLTSGSAGELWPEEPLVRVLVHHNQVRDAIQHVSDFGAIEGWFEGPAYYFNNVVINAWGYVPHRRVFAKNPAYYFDHGIKHYFFNNLGWSETDAYPEVGTLNKFMLKQVQAANNWAFHNTSYDSRSHYQLEGKGGDFSLETGNLMLDAATGFHAFGPLDSADHAAITRNVYGGSFQLLYSRWRGAEYSELEAFNEAMASLPNLLSDSAGFVSAPSPVLDAAAYDFRPTDQSASIDRGSRVFVPWSLARTVGEWHFLGNAKRPNEVPSLDVYPQKFHTWVGQFKEGQIDNRLFGEGFDADDYVDGPLESWVRGALRFDGSQELILSQERLIADIPYELGRSKVKAVWPGRDRRSVRMTNNAFIIEAVLRLDGRREGMIAQKLGERAGYALGVTEAGKPLLLLRSGGLRLRYVGKRSLEQDHWHHLLIEVDRKAQRVRCYLDGEIVELQADGRPALLGSEYSLDCEEDFVVGRGLLASLDFLRISQGTLEDARTNMTELMAWQFKGPMGRDFTGRWPTGGIRDVGALEHPKVSGVQLVRAGRAGEQSARQQAREDDSPESRFLSGAGRRLESRSWGAISAPEFALAGERVHAQVLLVTETVTASDHLLCLEITHRDAAGRQTQQEVKQQVVRPFEAGPFDFHYSVPVSQRDGSLGLRVWISPDDSEQGVIAGGELVVPVR